MSFCNWLKKIFQKKEKPGNDPRGEFQSPMDSPPEVPVTIPHPASLALGYFPPAIKDHRGKFILQGLYRHGYPEGAVIHYSSGRDDVDNLIDYFKKKEYCTFIIARDGDVYQNFPIRFWGFHCGASKWKDYNVRSLNSYFVGIEVISAGKLDVDNDVFEGEFYRSWFGKKYRQNVVRRSENKDNIKKGYYHKFTQEQEMALTKLLLWLKVNDPYNVFKIENIVGHDEIAPDRKSDPGGCLSKTMPEFRKLLNAQLS